MSKRKSAAEKSRTPVLAIIVIIILIMICLINGVTIIYKYFNGLNTTYKPDKYDNNYVVQERFGEVADTFQRKRRQGFSANPEIKGSMAVGEYYYYAMIRDALEIAGDTEGAAYYRSVTDEARANAGQFSGSTETIDRIIKEAVRCDK